MRSKESRNRTRGLFLSSLVGLLVVQASIVGTTAVHDDDPLSGGKIGEEFGTCPEGKSCESRPHGSPFPPDFVTGHSVYASWRISVPHTAGSSTSGVPSSSDPMQAADIPGEANVQRECVTWFNGRNLDQRPGSGENAPGIRHYPGDDPLDGSGVAYQDYTFDRDAEDCRPQRVGAKNESLGLPTDFAAAAGLFEADSFEASYVVAVESGGCDPINEGTDHRYRGHLDFVDPNGVYHEVQEYDYKCALGHPQEPHHNLGAASPLLTTLFPWTGTDLHNQDGCRLHDLSPPALDLGHKCNGSLQDLVTQRLWITQVHDPVHDFSLLVHYNFAIQVDTCAGENIYDIDGKTAMGEQNDHEGAEVLPNGHSTAALERYHEAAYRTYYSSLLDDEIGGWPLPDVCTDGSSHSFTDTPRGRVVHSSLPPGRGDEEILRGNAFDFDLSADTFGMHRTDCRVQYVDWPMNTYPFGPPPIDDECYPEDHKTAPVDLYAYPETEHPLLAGFQEHGNGRTSHQ